MKPTRLFSILIIGMACFACSLNVRAQIKRVALVSVADTLCIHRHVGLTVFTNFIDTLPMNFPIIQHIEGKLISSMSPKYSVSVVQLPDSVLRVKNTFFSLARTKKIKQWIGKNKDSYDLVIVIDNMELSENERFIPKYTSGIYSGSKYASYYSTISFYAYRTSNLKQLEYYHQGGEFLQQIKGFELSAYKRNQTPGIRDSVSNGFKDYLDKRVEHFLDKSFIVPQPKIVKE